MVERPYFLEPGSIREDWRLGVAAMFAAGDGVKAAPGVLTGMGVSQTATTASGSVLVGAGWCVNQATSATGGAFLECLDSQATLDVFGAQPPESSARNDLIVYQSEASPRLRVIPGTASATPTDPAVPAQAVVLARVRVKAASAYGATPAIVAGDIDDLRTYTSLSGKAPVMQVFNASGTWNKPPGCVGVRVQVVGGGGAGGGAVATASVRSSVGGGGGAGGYAESVLRAADVADTVTVTVGAGGAGSAGNPGGDGGASSFGAYLSAAGGQGGRTATPNLNGTGNAFGGVGGTASGGQIVAPGSGGGGAFATALGTGDSTSCMSGNGGASYFGGGGAGVGSSSAGVPGSVGGGGGGAGSRTGSAAQAGGDGGRGLVVVTALF